MATLFVHKMRIAAGGVELRLKSDAAMSKVDIKVFGSVPDAHQRTVPVQPPANQFNEVITWPDLPSRPYDVSIEPQAARDPLRSAPIGCLLGAIELLESYW